MADRVIGNEGGALPNMLTLPIDGEMCDHFWILTDEPDVYVASAIWAVEQKLNPERSEEEVRWIASIRVADEG